MYTAFPLTKQRIHQWKQLFYTFTHILSSSGMYTVHSILKLAHVNLYFFFPKQKALYWMYPSRSTQTHTQNQWPASGSALVIRLNLGHVIGTGGWVAPAWPKTKMHSWGKCQNVPLHISTDKHNLSRPSYESQVMGQVFKSISGANYSCIVSTGSTNMCAYCLTMNQKRGGGKQNQKNRSVVCCTLAAVQYKERIKYEAAQLHLSHLRQGNCKYPFLLTTCSFFDKWR